MSTGPWSGYLTESGGKQWYFCDWEDWSFYPDYPRFKEIYLSATKMAHCT